MSKKKIDFNMYWYLLVVVVISIFITLPQLYHHVTIIGTDSLFHYNRFYDVAMQIKHHNFSYFMQLYGFLNSGRIVTAVYSPGITYLLGGLLLVCGSFFRFAIVTRLLFFILAALSMNSALKIMRVKNSVLVQLVSVLYAFTPAINSWGMAQNFSGIGAICLPLIFGCGVRMLKRPEHPISWLQLGGIMAIVLQTHLATAIQSIVILIFYAVLALIINPKSRWKLVKNGIAAALLCIGLSLNIIAGMLELYADNIIVPVVAFDLKSGKGIYHLLYLSDGGWVNLFFILIVLVIMLSGFKRLSIETKATGLLSVVLFLFATTMIVDWPTVMASNPILNNTLQFPGRLKGPAITAALITIASVDNSYFSGRVRRYSQPALVGILALFAFTNMVGNFRYSRNASRQVLSSRAVLPDLKRTKKLKQSLTEIMRSPLSDRTVNLITKSTPDYMPATRLPNQPVYGEYQRQIIRPSKNSSHVNRFGYEKVVRKHQIVLKWQGNGSYRTIPIAFYHNSRFQLNGQKITPKRAKGILRLPLVREGSGKNVLRVTYHPRVISRLLLNLSMLNWVLMIVGMAIYEYRKRKDD